MKTKLETLKYHMAAGDFKAALKLAAGWPHLGDHKVAITRAWAALVNPKHYVAMGYEPETLIDDGIKAIRERYNIPL